MRKSLLVASIISTALLSTAAFAGQKTATSVQGGFNGPFHGITSVENAAKADEDTPVMLTGYVLTSAGDEMYQFKDATGEISIEIDHDKWQGLDVTPETKVTIYGEVDKDFAEPVTIDVDRIRLAS